MSFIKFTPEYNQQISYKSDINLLKDKTYVIHSSLVNNLIGTYDHLEIEKQYVLSKCADNKKILFIRTVGRGDMLFLSPIIKLIKEIYSNVQIDMACIVEQMDFANIIYGVDNVISCPIELHKFEEYDYYFEISNIVEKMKENPSKNIYDIILEQVGYDGNDNNYKIPYIKDEYTKKSTVQNNRIGIHPFANDPLRQYNFHLLHILILRLKVLGFDVVIFGTAEEKQLYHNYLPKDIAWSHGDIQNAINLIQTCKHIIATDSLFTHLCQALNKHCISLYGPFASKSRVAYYKNITIIDSNPPCRCSLHGVGICNKSDNFSICMNIEPHYIISAILNHNIKEVIEIKNPTDFKTKINEYNIGK